MNKLDFLCRGYSESEHKWFEGYYFKQITSRPCFSSDPEGAKHYIIYIDMCGDWGMADRLSSVEVIPESIAFYTGFRDCDRKPIYDKDIVNLYGSIGEVCFEAGAWGIGFPGGVDWKKLEKKLGKNQKDYIPVGYFGCGNDNFISFWELTSYFDWGSDQILEDIKIIGNKYQGITEGPDRSWSKGGL
jgi:hypothetical protein